MTPVWCQNVYRLRKVQACVVRFVGISTLRSRIHVQLRITFSIRRRRFCSACGGRFTTYERVQLRDLVVIKSNGRREDFEREKLERSIRIALQKRPVEHERMEQMISGIVRRLESMGETDIQSKMIGEIVMEALARIDTVAYVRFASVYKNFQEADDFDKFVSELRPKTAEEE